MASLIALLELEVEHAPLGTPPRPPPRGRRGGGLLHDGPRDDCVLPQVRRLLPGNRGHRRGRGGQGPWVQPQRAPVGRHHRRGVRLALQDGHEGEGSEVSASSRGGRLRPRLWPTKPSGSLNLCARRRSWRCLTPRRSCFRLGPTAWWATSSGASTSRRGGTASASSSCGASTSPCRRGRGARRSVEQPTCRLFQNPVCASDAGAGGWGVHDPQRGAVLGVRNGHCGGPGGPGRAAGALPRLLR